MNEELRLSDPTGRRFRIGGPPNRHHGRFRGASPRRRVAGIRIAVGCGIALFLSAAIGAAVPDYQLGDTAQEDVITPMPLLVVNPEATETLRQKVAQQVHLVVLQATSAAAAAEAELRESVATARTRLFSALEKTLNGRTPGEADASTPVFARVLRDMAREAPKEMPWDRLTPLWLRGDSDEALIESLARPVREVMAQPIVASKTDSTFPPSQPVRLVKVKNLNEPPPVRELETAGQTISSGKVISLWRARRLVETHFPSGKEELGKFSATFVRANAEADASLTEILRARRMEGVTVNDTYEAAQVVVRKGQTIDRKALSALAALREKSLIGTLQSKLELEKVVVDHRKQQTLWIAGSLGAVCLVLVVIVWRLRSRPGMALAPLGAADPLTGADPSTLPGGRGDNWRNRALLAEAKAERAHMAIRSGALGWMREKLFQMLFRHRTELLTAQQMAESEMRELEQRLAQLQTPLQQRLQAYERRIAELERDLAAKGEENRELLGARLAAARQQLILERDRGPFTTN